MGPATNELTERYLTAEERARLAELEVAVNGLALGPADRVTATELLSDGLIALLVERGWRGGD